MGVYIMDCVFVCVADKRKQSSQTVAFAYADYISLAFSRKISLAAAAAHTHTYIHSYSPCAGMRYVNTRNAADMNQSKLPLFSCTVNKQVVLPMQIYNPKG